MQQIKLWISAAARRIANRAKSAIINRRIESGYRQQKRLAERHAMELAVLQQQQQDEMQRLAGLVARRESVKHRLNGQQFIADRG